MRRGVLMLSGAYLVSGALLPTALAHRSKQEARLPSIGPAPDFELTTHAEQPFTLKSLRGQVVVLTFIFTSCKDTCPALTAKLVGIQRKLSADKSAKVAFAAITVDPAVDTPAVLARYARSLGATDPSWLFLSGAKEAIADVTRRYAVFARQPEGGSGMDHTFLTSLIDRQGMIRVQYLGVQFSPKEFIGDVRALLAER